MHQRKGTYTYITMFMSVLFNVQGFVYMWLHLLIKCKCINQSLYNISLNNDALICYQS